MITNDINYKQILSPAQFYSLLKTEIYRSKTTNYLRCRYHHHFLPLPYFLLLVSTSLCMDPTLRHYHQDFLCMLVYPIMQFTFYSPLNSEILSNYPKKSVNFWNRMLEFNNKPIALRFWFSNAYYSRSRTNDYILLWNVPKTKIIIYVQLYKDYNMCKNIYIRKDV